MSILRSVPPSERNNAICPIDGPIAISRLPLDEARAAVVAANAERAKRRGMESVVSESEIDLLAAFLYYGYHPELQYPVGHYDADFFFPRYMTAIEVDGRSHAKRWIRDLSRDRYFENAGITTLRVQAKVVWRDPLQAANDLTRRMVAKWIRAA